MVREFGKMKNIVRELVNQAFLGEGASRMATLYETGNSEVAALAHDVIPTLWPLSDMKSIYYGRSPT